MSRTLVEHEIINRLSMNCVGRMRPRTMPRDPKGEKRPADVIGAAVMVGKIATSEVKQNIHDDSPAAILGRNGHAPLHSIDQCAFQKV